MDEPDPTAVPQPDPVTEVEPIPASEAVAGEDAAADDTPAPRPRTGLRVLTGIALGVAIAYLGGVAAFSQLFLPRTSIGPVDVSLTTRPVAAQRLDAAAERFALRTAGKGIGFDLNADDIDLDIQAEQAISSARAAIDPWRWPLAILSPHRFDAGRSATYDEETLRGIVDEVVSSYNLTATAPTDATVAFDENKGAFVVRPEKPGTRLALRPIVESVDTAIRSLDHDLVLEDGVLVQPSYRRDDPVLAQVADEANGLLGAKITLRVADRDVYTVDPAVLVTFMDVDRTGASFNEEGLSEWAQGVEASLNTVGSERRYQRPDGKEVVVSGGTYGWSTQSGEVADRLLEAVHEGENTTIEVPVVQSADTFALDDAPDWGRYIDVDLAEQHARFYDEKGNIIWDSPIVTGRPGMGTPTGVWRMNPKLRYVTLVGRIMPETGEPEYRTPVAFWMPFVGSSIGFHDATWQYAFGGARYVQGFGSHGCVNLPYNTAESLYPLVELGDAVVVHW